MFSVNFISLQSLVYSDSGRISFVKLLKFTLRGEIVFLFEFRVVKGV